MGKSENSAATRGFSGFREAAKYARPTVEVICYAWISSE